MKKLFDSAVQTLIQKRFSYVDLIIIAIVEWLIITLR
jgi:hypothetical protein